MVCQFKRGSPAVRAATAVPPDQVVVVSLTPIRQPRQLLPPSPPARSFPCADLKLTSKDRRQRRRGRGRSGTGQQVRGRQQPTRRSRRRWSRLLESHHQAAWQRYTASLNHQLQQDRYVSLTAAVAALVASSSHGSRYTTWFTSQMLVLLFLHCVLKKINVKNFHGSLTTVVRAQNNTSKTASITNVETSYFTQLINMLLGNIGLFSVV